MAKKASTSSGRKRRSTEEIVDRMHDAASAEFETNGYSRTKTAAIAQKAGVSEALLFKHFGSKANLFHDTIFRPINQHFTEFSAQHVIDSEDLDGRLEVGRQYIGEMQEFIKQHSSTLMLLITSQNYDNSEVNGIGEISGLHEYFERTSNIVKDRTKEPPNIDPLLMACISFSTILSSVIFKDWLFPKGAADDQKINAAITDFVLGGLSANLAPKRNPA